MTSKGGAVGSASERVLFFGREGEKEANDLSFCAERIVFFLQICFRQTVRR